MDFFINSRFEKNKPRFKDNRIDSDNIAEIVVDKFITVNDEESEVSWSKEIEKIHEKSTRTGWIDVAERRKVMKLLSQVICKESKRNSCVGIIELGAGNGYMVEELKNEFPQCIFIASDLMYEGLAQSFIRNPEILHLQCDSTDVPICNDAIDIVYALNMMEHISDDRKAIEECYRILKMGGYCLLVVPRGDRLYDYFDEMLFHKRRYAKGELRKKMEDSGFQIVKDFHFAWLCYPIFWIKKKCNRIAGKHLSQEDKLRRTQVDIKNAMTSPLAIRLMKLEAKLNKVFSPTFGVREFILARKM